MTCRCEHEEAWPLAERKRMMRAFIASSAARGKLNQIDPAHVARTFGGDRILKCEVEAEMLKHMEEAGK